MKNLGSVQFQKNGRNLVVRLNGFGEWECPDDPDVALYLGRECSMDDYSAAHGRPGVSHLLLAAKLLGGTPHFQSEASKGDQNE